ncbi:MAG: hypothetical protein AABX51_07240 [Nanoarchaeota archaeon]
MDKGLLDREQIKAVELAVLQDKRSFRNGYSPQEDIRSILPEYGWKRTVANTVFSALEEAAFLALEAQKLPHRLTGFAHYGLKEVSGKENLEVITEKEHTLALLCTHESEADYSLGHLLRHEGIPRGHTIAGSNLITNKKDGSYHGLLKLVFDADSILKLERDLESIGVDRNRSSNYTLTFNRLFGQIHTMGGNTFGYPSGTRTRTNEDWGKIGDKKYFGMLLRAQEDSDKPIYAIPITVTYDRVFNASNLVGQNVTGIKKQDAEELSSLTLPLLKYSFFSPVYLHVGMPLNISEYLGTHGHQKRAQPALIQDFNEELIKGIYATPTSFAASALKSFMPFDGSVADLAEEVKKTAEIMSDDPNTLRYSRIAVLSSMIAGNDHVSQHDLVMAIHERLALAHARGILMPAIISHASASEVLKLAEKRGALLDFARYDSERSEWSARDGMLTLYYAGAIDKRIEQALHST